MAKPAYRIVFKPADGGPSAEVATLWNNDFGGMNLSPVKEESDSEYGKRLPLVDAIALSTDKKGYLNVWPVGERKPDNDEF